VITQAAREPALRSVVPDLTVNGEVILYAALSRRQVMLPAPPPALSMFCNAVVSSVVPSPFAPNPDA
jgi:hypothetical protein